MCHNVFEKQIKHVFDILSINECKTDLCFLINNFVRLEFKLFIKEWNCYENFILYKQKS